MFLFSRSMFALMLGILIWPALMYLVDAYDLFFPILESEASNWLVGVSVISFLVVLVLFWRFWRVAPNSKQMAKEVERANPELLDLLNCAVELDKKSKEKELSFMERRVLRLTEEKTKEIAWGEGTRPAAGFWLTLLTGLITGGALCGWSLQSSPVQKALDANTDEPGLSVFTCRSGDSNSLAYEPSHEFTRGTDVSIFADITRGHRGGKSAFVEFLEKQDVTRIEMLNTSIMGRFEFVVPALQQPFTYRISTPSLISDWFELKPFDPPALQSAKWKVIPPAYTDELAFSHEGFGYLRAPEGSTVQLDLKVEPIPEKVGVFLRASDGNHTLQPDNDNVFQHQFTLGKEWSGRIELQDLQEPNRDPIVYDDIVLSPIPDEPPQVEITEPAKDLQLPADAQFLVEVFALDDHGISDVRINISHAGEQVEETIFMEPVAKEKTQTYIFDLNEKALAVGDVLTYMALAMDNKEPEGQLARSEIYFIEVLPPEGNSTEGGEGQGEGDSKEIPVRDFINKTKKIIRSTYDAMMERDQVNMERLSLGISGNALGLKHEMTKVFDENEGMFPIVDGIDLGELLNEATYHIEQTEIYSGDQMLEDSLEPSEKTLRKLVQLYALMRKMNKQKMKSKNGKPKESDQAQTESDKNEDSERPESLAEQLDRLAADLQKLEDLKDRQIELNSEFGRAAGSGTKGERNQKAARAQESLRRDLENIREEWYEKSGKLGEVAGLDLANDEMKNAAADLRRDEPREAVPHGDLAADALTNAVSELEMKMSGVAGAMVDGLSEQAQDLANRQRELKKETGQAKEGQGGDLKNTQDQLNEKTKDLLEQFDQTARSLGKFNENAMEDLLRGARNSREGGIGRSGQRASNSLLYEAFPQAEVEEGKVVDDLEDLQKEAEGVANKLKNLGNQGLKDLAEKLQEARENMPGMDPEEMKKESDELAKALGAMPHSASDERLQNLTQFFEQVAESEDPNKAKSMASAAVAEALGLVEQFFWQEAKQNLLRRNQATTAAPSRYKRQVEEYFRRIAEGE